MILSKTYPEPPFCEQQILRYAQSGATKQTLLLLNECKQEINGLLKYNICYRELFVDVKQDICDFGDFSVHSKNLADNLAGCNKVIAFAATIGIELDRLIAKYSRLSPAKAVLLQAIGAERVEALCDMFCADIEKQYGKTRPRFSAGYGDLPLDVQKNIFSLLDCERKMGITLSDSLLMSPSKSVTAFVGVGAEEKV